MKELKDESILPKNRLETLVDGIFAITMTIMILDLKTPENIPSAPDAKQIPDILYKLLPAFEAYVVSFILLGVFWLRHQIQFKYVRYATRSLISLNILFLLLIGCVPFTVGIMIRYPESQLSFGVYIVNLLLASIFLVFQWYFISRNKKVIDPETSPELDKRFRLLTMLPTSIYFLSFLISFVDLRAAFLLIYLDPLSFFVYYKLFRAKKFAQDVED